MFLKSIRFKITLLYMFILSLTLMLFSISVYQNFKSNMYGDLDDLLESKATGIANAINTYWEAQKLEALSEGAKESVFSKVNNINFAKISQHWVEEKKRNQRSGTVIQIYDVNGKEIASSENLPQTLALPEDIFNAISEEEDQYDNIEYKTAAGKTVTLRAYTMPVIENGKVSYIVQVAMPVTDIYEALSSLKVPFFVYLPLTVILTAVGGLILVNVAFNPVNGMIRTIRQITAQNLKLRVDIPDTKDEVKKLADTFNDMLVKLEESFLSERKFIQDISHELKTPLTILKGELEVALKRARSPEEYELTLESGLEEVDRISKIVDDLLILAKLDNKDLPLKPARLDLGLFIKEILDDVDVLAQQKDIKVNYLQEPGILLDADPAYLRRLLLNILDNAFKYTPAGGKVNLRLGKEDGFAQIKIADTGVGIPEEELSHIFDRFYRARKTHASPGFGLGLAIAESIVAMHKGKIGVQSKLNQGTAFTIYLPLAV